VAGYDVTGLTDKLTQRELEVLFFVANGFSDERIIATLRLTESQFHEVRASLCKKLAMNTPGELTAFAVEIGLVQ